MLGLMGFSGSLPLYVIHRYYIFVFIDRAKNKDACFVHLGVFAARYYASGVLAVIRCLSVQCVVCVCMSRSWILSKRINISS